MYLYLNQWAYNCLCMVIGFDVKDGRFFPTVYSLGSGLLLGNCGTYSSIADSCEPVKFGGNLL